MGTWRRFIYSDRTTKKFWEILLDGSSQVVRYGRVGTKGQKRTKEYPSEQEAVQGVKKLIAAKKKKGYQEVRPVLDWSETSPEWRPPDGLPEIAADPDEAERQLLILREEAPHQAPWNSAREWFLANRSADNARCLARELTSDALDLGASGGPSLKGELTPAEQRQLQREFEDLYSLQYRREQYLKVVMDLLAEQNDHEGIHCLVRLIKSDHEPKIKVLAAQALSYSKAVLSDEDLDDLLSLLDHPEDSYHYFGIISCITSLLIRQRPESAFAQLREYLRSRALKGKANMNRGAGILAGVGRREPLDPSWAALVLPLIRHARLAKLALDTITVLPKDEASISRLIKWLEKRSDGALQTDSIALSLLGQAGTPRALPIFTRALLGGAPFDVCLEALRRIDDPGAVTTVQQYLHLLQESKITTGRQVELAEEVLRSLQDRGLGNGATPVSEPAIDRTLPRRKWTNRKAPKMPKVPPVDEQRKSLVEELRSVGLDDHAALLIEHSIRFIAARDISATFAAGTSKLGGVPDLPKNIDWPHKDGKPMAFVGQINLTDVSPFDADQLLPSAGLLSFFVVDILDPYDTEHYLQAGRVFYFEADEHLEPAKELMPAVLDPYFPCRLRFYPLLKFRSFCHPRTEARLSKSEIERYEAIWAIGDAGHQLLGPRDHSWEAQRDADDVLLFQCVSDGHPDMCWGDVDDLYFYIPGKALRKRDFERVFVHCGE